MKTHLAPLLACAVFLGMFSMIDSAQSTTAVRVRILHSKSHQPMKGRKVQITGVDRQTKPLVGQTRSDGTVVFQLKSPTPIRMDVVDLDGYPCSSDEVFSTEEVLQKGVVATWKSTGVRKADEWCTPDSGALQPQAIPGEVVFFVHPLTARQRRERDKEE